MRVAVTGAQGFVGRHLVDALLARPGVEVLGLGRSADDRTAFTHDVHWGDAPVRAPLWRAARDRLAGERYRYHRLDLRETAAVVRVLGDFAPTCVIHLAAALRDQPLDELLASNVGAAAALLDALVGARLEACRVVLGSTGGVYGEAPAAALPLHEDLRGAPVDLYSLTKQASEDATRILAGRHGLRVVWARLFNLVGPGQDERHLFGRVAAQLAAIRAGLRRPELELGGLDCTRDFVDVRDAADALWLLACHGEAGQAYNIASGRETRVADAIALLIEAAALAAPVEVRSISRRAADVPRHWGDIARIRRLGFEPRIGLPASARAVLDYYRAEVEPAVAPAVAAAPPRIAVSVASRDDYTIEVADGLVDRLHARLAADFPGRRLALVTDARVWELYGRGVIERAGAAGVAIAPLVVPEGERSKSAAQALALVEQLHHHRLDRRGVVVGLGGGMVLDLAGFVAATYLRGVDYVNVPTTLLAQHDAAIGGKVAVNAPWGSKNYLGGFHHPRAVYCDPRVLRTLSARDLSAGVAEAIKVALCGEPALLRLLEIEVAAVRAAEPATLAQVVRLAAARKVALLALDPYEVDLRRVLNLGHTVGHALEVEYGHDDLLHGEAVAFGIAVAVAVAVGRGRCARVDAQRIIRLLAAYDLPPRIPRARAVGALRRLDDIRLVRGNRLNFVIPVDVHGVHVEAEIDDAELDRAVAQVLGHAFDGDPARPA
jgi:3-dehydroquinate synthetase/nucleoside-diphosphate-sugar epimerase